MRIFMKKLSILFTGAALCLLLAFPIVIYAQNHNPEFEVSNLSFSGSNYIFIGEDDDEVMEPPRTEITLRYRDGGDAPEDGTTTLEWVTDGGADDGSTRVLAFDAEDTVTGGFTDGDGDQSTTGPWYWTGGDAQESYPGNALYLQGVADTLDAEGNVTNSYSGNTVKLKASHSDSSNVPFDKEFDLINKPDLSVTDPAGVEVQEQDEEDPGMVIASADENGNFNTRLIAKAVDAGGNYRMRLSQDIPLYSDSSGSNSVTLTASNGEYVTTEFDASSDTTYYVSPPENVTGVITAELDWWEDGEPVTNQPTIEGADTVTLLKVDLTADPGKIHLGFDPPNLDPASGENDDPSVYWASVVQGGTNNIVNLNMPGGNFSNFEWIKNSGDGATVSHDESATGDSTDLTITATGSGSAIQEPEFYLVVKGSTQPLLTLNVMVLPQRTLPLAVYEIEDPTSPDTTITGVPSIDDFVTICNDVFKQAGVQFTAVQQEGHDLSGTIYYPYDTREIYNYHYVDAAGAVDREPDTMLTRSEQEAFFNTPLIENPEYRVFTRELEELGGSKDNLNWALFRRGAISYSDISADPPPGPPFTRGGNIGWLGVQNLVEDLQLQLALAHEVAHVLVGDSIDDDGGYHDLGPYPEGVEGDEPNGVPPEKPGNAFSGLDVDGNALFETEHLDEPNPAILSPGTPANGRLPWPYGRWMRNEEWKAANEEALSREIIINNASGGQ